MRPFLSLLIITLIVLFQVSFLPHFRFFNVTPNLILVIVVCFLLLKDYNRAFFWALFAGLILDLYSGTFFGLHTLSLLFIVLIVYYVIENVINNDDFYSKIGICILTSVLNGLIFWTLNKLVYFIDITDFKIDFSRYFISSLLSELFLNVMLVLLIYKLIKIIYKFFVKQLEEKINLST